MVRSEIFQRESCNCGKCVVAAGLFQPGDGTRYVFQAERHPSAVGHWGESESYRACSDPFVDEIAKMTGALNPTIWAFVQWFCETVLS
jgi:hypothetical protein